MKSFNFITSLLTATLMFSACRNDPFRIVGCSVSLNNVVFTRSLNNALTMTSPAGAEKLIIQSGPKSDFFNEPDGSVKYGNAPLLLTGIDNQNPFTFSVKVTPQFNTTYDAGALYIYLNNNLWQKFAFEMDEKTQTRIVTVRTNNTSDDNNHDVVSKNSVLMKISSDTKSIGFYYSTDSITWQLVRVYKNSYPSKIWIGISSQSPLGNGINTVFEECKITKEAVKDFRSGI